MTDIFSQGKSLNPTLDFKWFNFANVNDKCQGVYIGIVKNIDNYGNAQTTYLLEQESGEVLGVGVKDYKTSFHELMKKVKIGQIVGVIFTKTLASKNGGNPAKILEIFTDPNIIDPKWSGQYGIHTDLSATDDEPSASIPENIFSSAAPTVETSAAPVATPTTPSATGTISEKVKRISELAKTKLQAMNAEEVKLKVTEKTNLTFTPENLDEIILQLELL